MGTIVLSREKPSFLFYFHLLSSPLNISSPIISSTLYTYSRWSKSLKTQYPSNSNTYSPNSYGLLSDGLSIDSVLCKVLGGWNYLNCLACHVAIGDNIRVKVKNDSFTDKHVRIRYTISCDPTGNGLTEHTFGGIAYANSTTIIGADNTWFMPAYKSTALYLDECTEWNGYCTGSWNNVDSCGITVDNGCGGADGCCDITDVCKPDWSHCADCETRNCCADNKCHKKSENCPCTKDGQNCSENCCNGRSKCSDGTCRGCTNTNQTIESCADGTCCDSTAKPCSGKCKTCADDGEDCGLSCCLPGHGKCSDSGNTCVLLGIDGQNVGATGCCGINLVKCPDNVCRSCSDDGTCKAAPCCSGTRCNDNVCRTCIPSGKPDGMCGSLQCCGYDCQYDNTCRDCTPDNHQQKDCQKSGTSAPCCNYHCKDSDGIDRCRSVSNLNQTYKCDKDGTPTDIPCADGLYQCNDGICRGCTPIGASWTICPEAPCCSDGNKCDNGLCVPATECCLGMQRCADGQCHKCTQDWFGCTSSDACCCSWESSYVLAGVSF